MQVRKSKMQDKWAQCRRLGAVAGLALGAGFMAGGVAQAEDINGGFQSNTTGAVPIQMVFGPAGQVGGPGGSVNVGSLSPEVATSLQTSLQTLATGAAGLPSTELAAAGDCVTTNFPDSPAVRSYRRALNAVTGDISRLNAGAAALAPGSTTLSVRNLNITLANSSRLRQDLMNLIRATNILAPTATPDQMRCLNQTYDAIEKAVTALEQIVPALNSASSALRGAH